MAVFVSHSSKDDAFVDKLIADLHRHGVRTFVDHHDIPLAHRWDEEVERALDTCAQMIAIISPRSIDSRNCRNEWYNYVGKSREIIPVWLDGDSMFFEFETVQWVDLRNYQADPDRYESGVRRIAEFLTDEDYTPIPHREFHNPVSDKRLPLPAKRDRQYTLRRNPEKHIGIVTGNIGELRGIDVLVNSENSQLEMDRRWNPTVSGALNSFGAIRDGNGRVVEEFVEKALHAARQHLDRLVPIGTVVLTEPGRLINNGVRQIAHAVTVDVGTSRPVAGSHVQLNHCLSNTLHHIDLANQDRFKDLPLKSVAFPIFGTGNLGLEYEPVARRLVERTIEYLEFKPDTQINAVYFLAYKQEQLDSLRTIFDSLIEVDIVELR